MSKAKKIGHRWPYIPNAKADMRFRKNIYQRGREIAERDPPSTRAQRREQKRMEALKYGRPAV